MNVVFMGTPEFARVCLEALVRGGHNIMAVITQPDRPAGRGKKPQMSAVKTYALEQSFEVFQPERINRGDFPEKLAAFGADIFVVAAFGQILSQKVLDIPKYGAVNVHASLLPKYRGAAPIQQAILDGETATGITIMQMDAGMDTGDMLLKQEVVITPEDTGGTLHDKLCYAAPSALLQALDDIAAGKANPEKQDEAQATYAPMISKEMARIDPTKSAQEIVGFVRGYNPFPGAITEAHGKILKVWKAAIRENRSCDGVFIQANDGFVELLEITPQNSKKMTGAEFLRGLK
ncbi:MAG: methionyl-tRNA formyltransferase [Defluviitaleaceae bacterium]|nr:methionyl-tRNA formyltransferase [Defluviitaleaceae bacterium]